jgi:hypothetical protein
MRLRFRIGAASVLGVLLVLPLLGRSPQAAQGARAILETLGSAYAQDAGTTLTTVVTGTPVIVSAQNQATLIAQVQQALAVGVPPRPGEFEAVSLDRFTFPITMAGGRSPRAEVASVVTPGRVVVPVTWTFKGSAPVSSYAVMSGTGAPVFDTLLSLPMVPGALFRAKHF